MKNKVRSIILTLLLVVILAIVFGFSSQPGESSHSLSQGIAYHLLDIWNKIFGRNWSEEELLSMQYLVRKAAHMTEYAVIMMLLYGILSDFVVKRSKRCIMAFLILIPLAAFDEVHQLFVMGRDGKFSDVLVDCIGGTIGILLVVAGGVLWQRCREKKESIIQ